MQKLIVVFIAALLLVACQSSSDKKSATSAEKVSPKKIGTAEGSGGLFSSVFQKKKERSIILPPDLLETANSTVAGNHNEASAAENTVLPKVVGAEIIGDVGNRYLRVETDAQNVWNTLADFWAVEDVELVDYRPAAGLMETDWISTNKVESSEGRLYFKHLFNRVVGKGVSFDKFKIRLEREEESITRIFVSHQSTAKKASETSSKKVTQYNWVAGEGDEEKVAQLLQVMILLFEKTA